MAALVPSIAGGWVVFDLHFSLWIQLCKGASGARLWLAELVLGTAGGVSSGESERIIGRC